jgi:hypothetical protein
MKQKYFFLMYLNELIKKYLFVYFKFLKRFIIKLNYLQKLIFFYESIQ